jgi:predicted metal-binding protein
MPSSILFICRSCHRAQQRSPEQPADGAALCDRLQALHRSWQRQRELEIRGVDCLWTCDHACCIALSAKDKPTYVLANVPIEEGSIDAVARAVLTLSERYLDSPSGAVPWKHFPDILQTKIVARIPPAEARYPDPTH